jgi:hypothetical protein
MKRVCFTLHFHEHFVGSWNHYFFLQCAIQHQNDTQATDLRIEINTETICEHVLSHVPPAYQFVYTYAACVSNWYLLNSMSSLIGMIQRSIPHKARDSIRFTWLAFASKETTIYFKFDLPTNTHTPSRPHDLDQDILSLEEWGSIERRRKDWGIVISSHLDFSWRYWLKCYDKAPFLRRNSHLTSSQ